jgi:hypothetical protein
MSPDGWIVTPEEREARRVRIRQMISTWPEATPEQIKAINAVLWVNHPNNRATWPVRGQPGRRS